MLVLARRLRASIRSDRRPTRPIAVVAALCLVGSFAASARATVSDFAPGDACPDVLVIGARGSGQEDGSGGVPDNSSTLGLGHEVYGFASHLADVLAPQGKSVGAWSNAYPAIPLSEYLNGNPDLFESVEMGRTNTRVMVAYVATTCGARTRIVLVGYSQGAMVARDGADFVRSQDRNRIAALVLIADPGYDPTANGVRIGDPAPDTGGLLGRVPPPSWIQQRTAYVCLANDVVCQSETVTDLLENLVLAAGTTIHTTGYQDPLLQAATATIVAPWVLAPAAQAVVDDAACAQTELPGNDDGSTGSVDIGFTLDFFGEQFSQLYVNNNGNVTFDAPQSIFTPYPLLSTSRKIIAPFFADVDTRNADSDRVRYGYGETVYEGHRAFCVDWVNVGYYASGADKLNSFQLLLVNRSDVGDGDFDIVMNYDRVEWEAGSASGGSGGLGGVSARVGYSNGVDRSFELPGSGTNGAFLDSNAVTGLIHNARGSTVPGRLVFPVRNGDVATGHTVSGVVVNDTADPPAPVQHAYVSACTSDGSCALTTSDDAGNYAIGGLADGDYTLAVHPPGALLSAAVAVTVAGADVRQDLHVSGPSPPPAGTTIGPAISTTGDGLPMVNWNDPLTLRTVGCSGGTATFAMTLDGSTIRSGSLTEGPAGTYTATVAPIAPAHGDAHVHIEIGGCGSPSDVDFDVYVDPSGDVVDTFGDPVADATVTLLRANVESGPFTPVDDGSAVMSLANRANPDVTGATGHFGWDVIPGFYRVRAEKQGCHAPGDPTTASVESAVLTIPPAVTGLSLVLECRPDPAPVIHVPAGPLVAEATGPSGATVAYTASAADPGDVVATFGCLPASGAMFPLGTTTVHCTAVDAHGHTAAEAFQVLVHDTTAPVLALPSDQVLVAQGPAGATLDVRPSATDLVDGAVRPSCNPSPDAMFPISPPGQWTAVSCNAADAHGNDTDGSFRVQVLAPPAASPATPTIDTDPVAPTRASFGLDVAALRALLTGSIAPHDSAARIRAVLRNRGYALAFDAPVAGLLKVTWWLPARPGRSIGRPLIVATGRMRLAGTGHATLALRLTRRGRRILRNARHVKLVARGSFTPSASAPVTASAGLTLQR